MASLVGGASSRSQSSQQAIKAKPTPDQVPFWDMTHDVDDNVLYHSLLGLASPQQVSGSLVGDGDNPLK
jgi:hypothetical protein